MKPPLALRSWQGLGVLAAVAGVSLIALSPIGFGFPDGANKDLITLPDFATKGCTACHGGGAFAANPGGAYVSWNVTAAEGGAPLSNNAYVASTAYLITITLHNEQAPQPEVEGRHAGFNLRASAGKLEVPTGNADVKVTTDGLEATHANAARTNWTVLWTSPAAGAAVFDLFVNDVNGANGADDGDNVFRSGFWLTDPNGVTPRDVKEEAHGFGITLQQYWIGLIGLLGMVFIMVAGFVYLKFVNPHNTDQKDR